MDRKETTFKEMTPLLNLEKSYLEAVEHRSWQEMSHLWSDDAAVRAVTVFGIFDGSDSIQKGMTEDFRNKILNIQILDSEPEIIDCTENRALIYLSYNAVVTFAGSQEALNRTVHETHFLEREYDGNWKLHYIHQSIPEDLNPEMQEDSQNTLVQKILAMLGQDGDERLKSLKDRKNRIEQLFTDIKEEQITPELIHLQEQLLRTQQQNTALTSLPFIMGNDQRIAIWSGEPARLAVDSLISFMNENQLYDPWLSKSAGLGLQKDNYYHRHILKENNWVTGNYALPVKGIAEISMAPVYGLFTPKKQEDFESGIIDSLKKASDHNYRSAAVLPGWKDVLNVPVQKGAEIIVSAIENQMSDPENNLERIILISAKAEQAKALGKALDDAKTRKENLKVR